MKRLRATHRPKHNEGVTGALGLYLGVFLSIFAAFAASLYWLLQPSVNHNPGVAAYQPPPATVLASAPARPFAHVAEHPAITPTARPDDLAQARAEEPAVAEVKPEQPPAPVAEVKKKKRKAAKRRRLRDPMSDYAQYGNGYRRGDGYRSWNWRHAERRGGFRPWF